MYKKIAFLLMFVSFVFGGASVGASVNPNIDRALSGRGDKAKASCEMKSGSGTNDNEILRVGDGYFECERNACPFGQLIAVLGKAVVRGSGGATFNSGGVFRCQQGADEKWTRQGDISLCSQSRLDDFSGEKLSLKAENASKVLVGKSGINNKTSYILYQTQASEPCYAYRCNTGADLVEGVCATTKEVDTVHEPEKKQGAKAGAPAKQSGGANKSGTQNTNKANAKKQGDAEQEKEQQQKTATGSRTISGVVTCSSAPCGGANVVCEKTITTGVAVSVDGKFSLKCPINEGVQVSFFGMTTINISAKELAEKSVGVSIELKEEPIQMADVVVVACHDEAKGIKTGTLKDDVCVPTGCITPRWNLQGEDENAKCVEQECEHGWKQDESGKWVCEQNVQQTSGTAVETAQGADQAAVTDAAKGENATEEKAAEPAVITSEESAKGEEETKSEDKTEAETQAKAEDKSDGTECKSGAANVARGVWRDGKCVPAACNDGYELKDDNCVEIGGPCEGKPENSVSSHREFDPSTKKIECVIDSCKAGYVLSKDRFECKEDLEEKVKAAKEKEQSLGNRMLGGATMAATGAGGQMLATGLAEKKADENAEREMRAYLDTMNCEYGSGKIIKGGTKAVVIPGGNELINLYSQYVNLANDLKIRKEALGMRAGIESGPILDGATSGLYDDVSVGKTSGAYTSLARALSDPNGADAAAWAAQKDESQKQIKTGAIVAGAGAVVGLVGNVISNSDAVQNRKAKTAAVRKKYAPVIEDVENLQVQADTMSGKACSEFTGTTNSGSAPNCECTKSDKEFSVDNGGCIDKDKAESASAACSKVGVVMPGTCECVDNATLEGSVCTCKDGWHETESKACVKNDDGKEQTNVTTLTLSSDAAFNSGSANLTSQAKELLADFCTTLSEHNVGVLKDVDYKLTITGHSDRNNPNGNKQLSEKRANAVKDELSKCSLAKIDESRMQVAGVADAECTADKYTKPNDPACRKVTVSLWVAHEELSDVISNFGAGVTDALGGGVSGINLGDLDLSALAK